MQKNIFILVLSILSVLSCNSNDCDIEEYQLLKKDKALNDSLVNRYLKSVSVQTQYQEELKRILKFAKLKDRIFKSKKDLYIEFEVFPPFNQNREIYIVTASNDEAYMHYIKYNLKRECNTVTGSQSLDESCLTEYSKDSIKLNSRIIDTLNHKLNYYDFWNLKERTYDENEYVIMDGIYWSIEGIKGTSFDLPNEETQHENRVVRCMPKHYNSIKNIGEFLLSLKTKR